MSMEEKMQLNEKMNTLTIVQKKKILELLQMGDQYSSEKSEDKVYKFDISDLKPET